MDPQEPAGEERGEGKSAESLRRARRRGGPSGNTRGTVRSESPGCAIRLQGVQDAQTVGRGVSLPFFYYKKWRTHI